MQLSILLAALPSFSLAAVLQVTQTGLEYTDAAPKFVFAHFVVGNTYPYTIADWKEDISLAASKGFDAFALDVGVDPWQPARVADAFTAASNYGTGVEFKLFLSFDMSSLPCSQPGHADILKSYINTYHSHPNQFFYEDKIFVSTFSGENCDFGTGSVNNGWFAAVKTGLPPVHFVPAFFVDPSVFPSLPVMDGIFNWNGAWPMGDYDVNFTSDNNYISNLGGRTYMASASPWFFTHYGPTSYNKNFIYRGDDWLLSERWNLLGQNRQVVDLVQVISWNDYGESHYIGPIHGAQPNSQAWTNGFDHQGWLDLIAYHTEAFKTGSSPAITDDRLFLWARLYPSSANASDPVGKPTNWEYTKDYLWAVVFLTAPAEVTLACGSMKHTASLSRGISWHKLHMGKACSGCASVKRGKVVVKDFCPSGLNFSTIPPSYNFNAFVAAS